MKNHYKEAVELSDEKMRKVELVLTLCKFSTAAVEH